MTGRYDAVPPAPVLAPAWPDRAAWGTAPLLRAWQQSAMERYLAANPRDFLAVATPGAGKTTFALTGERLGHSAVLSALWIRSSMSFARLPCIFWMSS